MNRMIFFDIDNTLVDHNKSESLAILAFCHYLGISYTDNTEITNSWRDISKKSYNEYLSGKLSFQEQRLHRIHTFLVRFLMNEKESFDMVDHKLQKLFSIYLQYYEKNWCLFDDVLTCLESKNSKMLGIISNGETDQQIRKLEFLGIRKYFDIIVTSHDAGCSKPDKQIFVHAARTAKMDIKQCIYIGDDLELDAIASKDAGMTAYWLNRSKKLNTVPKEIYILSGLKDLPCTIDKDNRCD